MCTTSLVAYILANILLLLVAFSDLSYWWEWLLDLDRETTWRIQLYAFGTLIITPIPFLLLVFMSGCE